MKKNNLIIYIIALTLIFTLKFSAFATDINSTYVFSDTSFAIDKNGVLWGFGDNFYGQITAGGDAYISSPTEVLEDVIAVHATKTTSYALKTDGTLWQWGQGFLEPTQILSDISSLNSRYISHVDGTFSDLYTLNGSLISHKNNILLFNGEVFARDVKQYEINQTTIYALANNGDVNAYSFTEESISNSTFIMNNIAEISKFDDVYLMLSNSDTLYSIETQEVIFENVSKYSKNYALDNKGNLYSLLNEKIVLEKIADFNDIDVGVCFILEENNALWYQTHFFDVDDLGNPVLTGLGNISTKITDDIIAIFDNCYALKMDNNLWHLGNETTDFISSDYATSYFPTTFNLTRVALPALNIHTSTYDNILNDNSNEIAKNLAEVVALEYGVEVLVIYELGTSIHYVVYSDDDVILGGTVITIAQNNENAYIFGEFSSNLASQEELSYIVSDYLTTSNLSIDLLPSSDLDTLCTYLETLLSSIPANQINDSAKSEIVNFIEGAISQQSAIAVLAEDNATRLTQKQIEVALEAGQKTKDSLEAIVTDSGITLNKAIEICILVVFGDVSLSTPLQITLDSTLQNSLNEASAQLLLEDGRHGISFSSENLNAVLAKHTEVTVQIQKETNDVYACYFLDMQGDVIDQLPASIGIILPAEHSLYTVIANLSSGDVNWGGQFNEVNKSILFKTPYSSKYLTFDNSIDIKDIDDLYFSEIAFMVSKGFFNVDENGNFYPNESLTRYDFTKTLVGMFFSLQTSLETTFTDVPVDSDYYDYIASCQIDSIVEGFSDNTFRGESSITTEQVLTLIARTLVDKKSYFYPEGDDNYISWVSGADKTAEWAISQIELTIRDGIVYPFETINPNSNIRREEAAVYLYRLFMLLEKVNATSFDLRAETIEIINEDGKVANSSSSSTFVVFIAIIGAISGAVIAVLYKNKLKSNQTSEENADVNTDVDTEENPKEI